MSSVNINLTPPPPRMPMPGYGMPGGGYGMPGINLPGGASINIGGDGHGQNAGCCKDKKEKDCKDKKDRGIIGDILTGLFGEDSFIGRLLGGKEKKCKCKKGRGHDQG